MKKRHQQKKSMTSRIKSKILKMMKLSTKK